jgi:thioredoxin reductase (NADPH)
MHSKPELTPTAIAAGRLLAKRLYDGGDMTVDYDTVPTAVFTPIEYACVGLGQEAAEQKFGVGRVDAFHAASTPLEAELPLRSDNPPPYGHNAAYLKVVVDSEDFDRVLGLHMVAPAASEAIQGFSLAMRKGLYKRDLDSIVGVHPTVTEGFLNGSLNVTKSSGKDPKSKGC